MAIKSNLGAAAEKPKYPYLGKSVQTGNVVLFTAACTGVCLEPGTTSNRLGEFVHSWHEAAFVPLKEPITLENY